MKSKITTNEEFDKMLKEWLVRIESILGSKAKEYAGNGDRLHNFRSAARIKGETMADALWGMAIKHLVSIEDLVKGRLDPKKAIVDEKLTDMVNYLILLSAVLLEGQNENDKQ